MKTINRNKLSEVVENLELNNYTFSDSFINIICEKLADYDKAIDFFNDLQKNGCVSGMIGDFVYHSDCKDFYVNHIDSLEEYKENMEEELGESIKNRFEQTHYTFMCWLCFEEFCYNIARELFHDDF